MFLYYHEPFKIPKFGWTEATTPGKTNRVQPKLGSVRVAFHMYVHRLLPVRRVEEIPVRTFAEDGRHGSV